MYHTYQVMIYILSWIPLSNDINIIVDSTLKNYKQSEYINEKEVSIEVVANLKKFYFGLQRI